MARYLIKFTKENRMKYISHLDLLRLFQRSMKRASIRLSYSRGYNPHAKMGFAIPLSLGFESQGEYMEIETDQTYEPAHIKKCLNEVLPQDLKVTFCSALKETAKTALAAVLEYASYKLLFAGSRQAAEKLEQDVGPFLKQEQILVVKYSKKKKKNTETDIRPMIHSITTVPVGHSTLFSVMLAAGSRSNLNPEIMAEELCRFAGVAYERNQWSFQRMEMYYKEGKNNMIPLSGFGG